MNFDFNKNINESLSYQQYKDIRNFYITNNAIKSVKQLDKQYYLFFNKLVSSGDYISQSSNNQNTSNNTTVMISQPDSSTNKEQTKTRQMPKYERIINDTGDIQFKNALLKIIDIHEQILDMYTNTLFEGDWDEVMQDKFEKLIAEYQENINYIKKSIPTIQWNSEANKAEFTKVFKEVWNADAETWKHVMARNLNYLRYRTNRKNIILQICDVIGNLKSTNKCDENAIFRYFNNRCANIKLFDNSNKADKKVVLGLWLKPHLNQVFDELRDKHLAGNGLETDTTDIYRIFQIYVQCREYAYKIFNMMVSNNNVNGYDKWHNRFIDYCDATLNKGQMEILINATDTENQFIEADDYQNIMDEESWEAKGLYESWFDDSLEYYRNHKERYNKSKINKINMVPTNANQCRVTCDGKNVYANATFYPGDIIEICPTKKIDKSALYSKDMRESVFEVVPNEEWVLPYGYCKFYLSDHLGDGNCNYIWDPANRVIVIKAINKIPKYSKLLLNIQI